MKRRTVMARENMSACMKDRFLRATGAAGLLCIVAGCHAATDVQRSETKTAPAAAPSREVPRQQPSSGAKESTQAPVQPAPAESRTPEEAAKRAADPKDPSGALIIEPKSK